MRHGKIAALPPAETVSIVVGWGNDETCFDVEAYVVRPIAVHRSIDYQGLWAITHMPTGLAMASIAGFHATARSALRAVDALKQAYDGWDELTHEAAHGSPALALALIEACIAARLPGDAVLGVDPRSPASPRAQREAGANNGYGG